jgi:hypothetical protein
MQEPEKIAVAKENVLGVNMHQHWHGRNIKMLWGVGVFGIAYSSLLYYGHTLTGVDRVDGIIGVVLGLYICSHPAANLVDMLFFRRGTRRQFPSKRSAVLWIAINTLVLLAAWILIFLGTTRLVGRID